ncbi:hypothetical protein CR513_30957, partial [Mucuna pruriens]
MALSTLAIQLRGHLSSNRHVTPRETSETGKLKFARGDRLGFQHTLVDLILSAQATRGEPPPSTMAISRPSLINLYRDHVGTVSIESDSASGRDESSIDPLYAFDLEIEKTLRRLRKARNLVVNNSRSSDFVINSNQLCIDNSVASSNIFAEPR